MRDLKPLAEAINNYNDKDIIIKFEGSLKLFFEISNARCIVTYKTLLIGNLEKNNKEFQIELDEVININIDKEIVLDMNGNYKIRISII